MPLQLPPAFAARMQAQLGAQYDAFVHALQQPAPTSVRGNPHKAAGLEHLGPDAGVPWCPQAFYLKTRPAFTLDPLHHAGAYYVQEASSMLLAQALDFTQPQIILDLCAAPGGKTTLLAALAAPGSLVVANEAIRSRAGILRQNVERWGLPNVMVTSADPERLESLAGLFDAVVVDAPCSSEGLWRKQPAAVAEWSEAAVQLCSARQQRIVRTAAALVKPGGRLVYCTCTFAPAENGQVVQSLAADTSLHLEPVALPALESFGAVPISNDAGTVLGYQCYPHRVRGEGFFISVMAKTDGPAFAHKKKTASALYKQTSLPPAAQPLLAAGDWHGFMVGETHYALPAALVPAAAAVAQATPPVVPGVALGQLKGKDFIPEHALALSTARAATLPAMAMDLEQALHFLKKEAPTLPPGTAAGWYVAAYQGQPLGWLKALPGRANNYLPAALRIRMEVGAAAAPADEDA
jgi:16S rRNA C967 or C1407 C5-methylase (RsmB/RsmF family)/NOL1/NOP2/fmu family ribosome biogenesis protein